MNAVGVLSERVAKTGRPYSAMLQVTERCNYRCSHCYQSHSDGTGELSLGEITGILDQLVELEVLLLTISGGEIFVRRDIEDILRAAQTRGSRPPCSRRAITSTIARPT